MSKIYNNSKNNNRVTHKEENWTEIIQQGDSQQQRQKSNKANKNQKRDLSEPNLGSSNEMIATVPLDNGNMKPATKSQSSCVPSLSAEHSINDSSIHSDDSIIQSVQDGSDENEFLVNNDENKENTINEMNQFNQAQQISSYPGEINCITNNAMYNTSPYQYDYNNNMMNGQYVTQPQQPSQQGSPYYVYHPQYSDYSLGTTPQQQAPTGYYTSSYQPVQSYIYDPNMATVSYTNMINTYSPIQSTVGAPQTTAVLSSPQHQSTILASYQTPPQSQHQLYISPSNITPPASLSPSETTPNLNSASSSSSSSSTIANEPMSNCNSPQATQIIPATTVQQSGLYQNQYLVYSTSNPYLTPQAYQSPIPTAQTYMMYPTPTTNTQTMPAHTQMTPTSIQNVPVMSPYQQHGNNHNNNSYTPNNKHHGRSNRYHNKNNNYRRNYNNNSNRYNMEMMSPVSQYSQSNMYLANNSPMSPPQKSIDGEMVQTTPIVPDQSLYTGPASNQYSFSDSDAFFQSIANNYEYGKTGMNSYADEYETYGETDSNLDNEDGDNEQLACYVCRGRRMCFCYFLKVRYYKFPSFFDLVDHQYKKWRSSMAKNNAANTANSSPNMNSTPTLSATNISSPISSNSIPTATSFNNNIAVSKKA